MNKRSIFALLLPAVFCAAAFAQQPQATPSGATPSGAPPPKFALVIGNGNYTGLNRLANPVNQ